MTFEVEHRGAETVRTTRVQRAGVSAGESKPTPDLEVMSKEIKW